MDHSFVHGKLFLSRTAEEREPILQRLRRIEGQVRGLQQMLEQDRYCGDELQQANAVVAAVREVALLIAAQHIEAGIACASTSEDPSPVLEEVTAIVRTAIRQA